jgi:hypothetical protein
MFSFTMCVSNVYMYFYCELKVNYIMGPQVGEFILGLGVVTSKFSRK